MKVFLFVVFSLFCLLQTSGAVLQCYECESSVSYQDCQNNISVVNCTSANDSCYQADVKFEKGSNKTLFFEKGCLQNSDCEAYNKGEIGQCITQKEQGYDVDCKAMCCHEDKCNKENIIPPSQGAVLQCSQCESSVSFEDCQNKLIVVNCSGSANDFGCSQLDIQFEKGSEKGHAFQKGCLAKNICETYSKGDIDQCTRKKEQGYETDCQAMCCYKDECNKEDIFPEDKGNKGSAFAISVMILLSGLLLTLVNFN